MSNISLILEGLHIVRVNESSSYQFYTNLDKDGIKRNYSNFKAAVDKFAKSMLPRMDANMKMVCELDDKEAVLYIYGWRDMYKDEGEFERVHDVPSMEKQVGSLLKANGILGKYQEIDAHTYWDAKNMFGYAKKKSVDTGPYVEVVYDTDDIYDK